MSENNLYAPPVAVVDDLPQQGTAAPLFMPISIGKLVLMSVCTLGMYHYFWIYRNWSLHRRRTGESLSPAARTIFAVFFIYRLFQHINTQADAWKVERMSAGLLALAWIVPGFLVLLPDPWWLLTFATLFALVPAQRVVNAVNDAAAPGHEPNRRLRGWNWLAVGLGGPILALAVLGAFLPAP